MWIALSHLGTCICHSELRLDLDFSQALADARQRKTSVRDTTADDLDDGAKAWGSEWLRASCITMRRGLSFSVAAALISKSYIYIYLSAYARQPARGPTMLAHLVAICWPMLAYVGLSCGQRGPILWLCWPMFASCWPMLSQKIRKMGTAKKHCKTQDILRVGGLSWSYVGLS